MASPWLGPTQKFSHPHFKWLRYVIRRLQLFGGAIIVETIDFPMLLAKLS